VNTLQEIIRRSFVLLFCLAFNFTPDTIARSEEQSEIVNAIFSAWEAREARISSAEISFDTNWNASASYYSDGYSGTQNERFPVPKDMDYEAKEELLYDGIRIKYAYIGPVLNIDSGELRQHKDVFSYNGTDRRAFKQVAVNNEPLQGYISDDPQLRVETLRRFNPIFWYLRPAKSILNRVKYLSIVPHGDQESDSDKDIVVLANAKGSRRYWVNTSKDCNIVRLERVSLSGELEWQIDVEYISHKEFGWIPDAWSDTSLSKTGHRIVKSRTTQIQVNHDIEPLMFDISFPPDTLVLNTAGGANRAFRVSESGVLVPLLTFQTQGVGKTWRTVSLAVTVGAIVFLLIAIARKRGII